MCRFNQHWLPDCNSAMKLRLLYLHHASSCHRDLAVPRLQDSFSSPISPPTCVIPFRDSVRTLMSDACHAYSHSSSINYAWWKEDKRQKCLLGLQPCRDMRGRRVTMNLWGAGWWVSNSITFVRVIQHTTQLRGMASVGRVPRVVLMRHFHTEPLLLSKNIQHSSSPLLPLVLSLMYFLSTFV